MTAHARREHAHDHLHEPGSAPSVLAVCFDADHQRSLPAAVARGGEPNRVRPHRRDRRRERVDERGGRQRRARAEDDHLVARERVVERGVERDRGGRFPVLVRDGRRRRRRARRSRSSPNNAVFSPPWLRARGADDGSPRRRRRGREGGRRHRAEARCSRGDQTRGVRGRLLRRRRGGGCASDGRARGVSTPPTTASAVGDRATSATRAAACDVSRSSARPRRTR